MSHGTVHFIYKPLNTDFILNGNMNYFNTTVYSFTIFQ